MVAASRPQVGSTNVVRGLPWAHALSGEVELRKWSVLKEWSGGRPSTETREGLV